MEITSDQLIREALEAGADRAAPVATEDIEFHEEFRKACERNACGRYNTSWMGPPAIGTIDKLKKKVRRYRQALLFQTIHAVSSSFDMKGMRAGKSAHERVMRDLLVKMAGNHGLTHVLPLQAGCCAVCPRCAYLDREPCRYPDKALSSLEAYGMDVMALARNLGMPYHNGKGTVTFFGLVLYDDEER